MIVVEFITDKDILALLQGWASADQRRDVLDYLASNPEALDEVFSIAAKYPNWSGRTDTRSRSERPSKATEKTLTERNPSHGE